MTPAIRLYHFSGTLAIEGDVDTLPLDGDVSHMLTELLQDKDDHDLRVLVHVDRSYVLEGAKR